MLDYHAPQQTTRASCAGCSGGFLTASPPAQQASAHQDQAGKSGTGDGAGGHVFACLLWIVFCGHGGTTFFDAFVPVARHLSEELMKGAAMLNAIKASLLGSALMLLASCTGYLTNYQTPCVQGHVCECVQYTTVYRSWLDCRAYGKDAPRRR